MIHMGFWGGFWIGVLVGMVLLAVALGIYSCAAMSGMNSRREEELERQERLNKN
jgi:hypothetical protein